MTRIREVKTDTDILTVARLAREIWVQHYDGIVGLDQIGYMLDKFQSGPAITRQIEEGYEYYLMELDGEAVGYVGIVPDTAGDSMMLSKIYVRAEARGRGVGKAALGFVEELCRERGIQRLWLTVNKNNSRTIEWYGRMGFATTGPIVQDIGNGFVMDDFRMEKAQEASPARKKKM